jgi:hypothetical protein
MSIECDQGIVQAPEGRAKPDRLTDNACARMRSTRQEKHKALVSRRVRAVWGYMPPKRARTAQERRKGEGHALTFKNKDLVF